MDIGNKESAAGLGGEEWMRVELAGVLRESIKEKKASRRWSVLLRVILAVYISFVTVLMMNPGFISTLTALVDEPKDHVAVIDISGAISATSRASAKKVLPLLQEAFAGKEVKGVILKMNSPGGSPVQSGIINDEINRLKSLHPEKKVYAVMEDICASGCYYIAVGADRIYADKATLVGSIGVVMNGFGFVDTMKLVGVERRIMTSGKNKGFLDPFSPVKEDEVNYIHGVLSALHKQFIDVVRAGRGDRLIEGQDELFGGLIWHGDRAKELGLIDGIGSVYSVARNEFKTDRLRVYKPSSSLIEKISRGLSASFAHEVGDRFMNQVVQ